MNEIKPALKPRKQRPEPAASDALRRAVGNVQESARKAGITEAEVARELAARKTERLSDRR